MLRLFIAIASAKRLIPETLEFYGGGLVLTLSHRLADYAATELGVLHHDPFYELRKIGASALLLGAEIKTGEPFLPCENTGFFSSFRIPAK